MNPCMNPLSDDILLEICSYLDPSSLLNLSQVDERWSSLIRENCSTMRKFTTAVSLSGVGSIDIKIDLEGRQQNLNIENLRCMSFAHEAAESEGTMRRLQNKLIPFKETVKRLDLQSNSLKTAMFTPLLSGFSEITHLKISSCRPVGVYTERDIDSSLSLPNLKHLTIQSSDSGFFKLLLSCAANLISLKLDNPFYNNAQLLIPFLENCGALRTLMLKNSGKYFMSEIRAYPFQLKKLAVDNLFDNKLSMEAVIHFLRQQKHSLRELEVKNAPRDLVLRCILADLQLEKLHIGINALQKDLNYFRIIPKNHHLKSLILRGSVTRSQEVVHGIIAQYPKIETLKFFKWEIEDATDLLLHISDSLRNLKNLRLPSLPGIISPAIDLRSLTSLHVSQIHDEAEAINWKFLAIYSPNIEKLTIQKVENCFLTNGNIELVTMKSKQLRELCLGNWFEYDEQALNIIKTTAKKLYKLTVFTKCMELTKTHVSRIVTGGLSVLIRSNDPCFFEKYKIEKREATIDDGPFNTIDNVEAFIRPPTANPPAREAYQERLVRFREFQRNVVNRNRFVRRRIENFNPHNFDDRDLDAFLERD